MPDATTRAATVRSGPLRYARAARFGAPELTDPAAPEPTDGAICPQRPSRLEPVVGAPTADPPQREDCLALSVIAPTTPGPHPVLVFLHGGAFLAGAGLLPWYHADALAAEGDVVVVTVNYRVGALGWLRLDGVSPGNLGLLDVLAALRWVRGGIARYGGDPGRVTLAGQSAGGMSVAALLGAPAARGLFHRAVAQSAPWIDDLAGSRPDAAAAEGRRFAELLGADPRTADPEALLDALAALGADRRERGCDPIEPPMLPLRGVDPVPESSIELGPGAGLDLLVGWNHDEVSAYGVPLDDAPAPSEQLFGAPWLDRADTLRAAGTRVAGYRLDWRPEGSPYGATHCLELPLLFGDPDAWRASPMLGTTPWAEVERLGRVLRAVWARFVHTGRVEPELAPDVPVRWAPDGDLASLRR